MSPPPNKALHWPLLAVISTGRRNTALILSAGVSMCGVPGDKQTMRFVSQTLIKSTSSAPARFHSVPQSPFYVRRKDLDVYFDSWHTRTSSQAAVKVLRRPVEIAAESGQRK